MKNFIRKYIVFILIILVIVLAGATTYFYRKSTDEDAQTRAAEAKSLVRKVGKLVVLPEGETPTIATVSDLEALREQAFFIGAKVGDKVLIYSNSKKAILFDPKQNKIINIAPLNAGGTAPQESNTSVTQDTISEN
jgi:uncharacterized protein YpmB